MREVSDRWKNAIAVASAGAILLGLMATAGTMESGPILKSEEKPVACATEDSHDCYWDAKTMGNGKGRSFVDKGGKVYYTDKL